MSSDDHPIEKCYPHMWKYVPYNGFVFFSDDWFFLSKEELARTLQSVSRKACSSRHTSCSAWRSCSPIFGNDYSLGAYEIIQGCFWNHSVEYCEPWHIRSTNLCHSLSASKFLRVIFSSGCHKLDHPAKSTTACAWLKILEAEPM